jgi:hypothetical protein
LEEIEKCNLSEFNINFDGDDDTPEEVLLKEREKVLSQSYSERRLNQITFEKVN